MGIKICPDCGGKVSESRSDCPHCGHIFSSPVCKQEENKRPTIQVVVKRESAFVGCAVASVISVDGQSMGSVNNGGECSFCVTPGLHSFAIGKGLNGPIHSGLVDGVQQIFVKPKGVLTIRFVVRTKLLLGFYIDFLSVEQV